jgi:spermidine synthase
VARFTVLGTAPIPNQQGELRLLSRNNEFTIKIAGVPGDLMNSRMHASEDALATLACERIKSIIEPQVLIGGLGMGFTLRAALDALNDKATVTVAELISEVVQWNKGDLGTLTNHPVNDPRTKIHVGDVGEVLRNATAQFDAILLDVDNGPEGHTSEDNGWIYTPAGLKSAKSALRPGGIVAYWSAGVDSAFTTRLRKAGFTTKPVTVHAHTNGKGARHVIWLAW